MNKLQYFRVEFTESADPVGTAWQAVWSCADGAAKTCMELLKP